MRKAVLAAVAVVVAAVVALGAWAAFGAEGEKEQTARETCDGRATELSVEKDDEGLEVSFELQSTAPGETWQVVLEQGDTVLLDGERQTDEDAELDVDAVAQESGSDEFTATATPADGGAACTTSVTR
jgi:hypothetical protein